MAPTKPRPPPPAPAQLQTIKYLDHRVAHVAVALDTIGAKDQQQRRCCEEPHLHHSQRGRGLQAQRHGRMCAQKACPTQAQRNAPAQKN